MTATTATCSAPIPWEELVAYWAGDLDAELTNRLEEHLIACDVCTASSERVATVTEGVRAMIPAFLSHERLAALKRRGLRIKDNPVAPSERKPALFQRGVDLLLHRLQLDLTRAEKVEVTVTNETTGQVLRVDTQVPFDREKGEILVACQRHFGQDDRTIVFEVRLEEVSGTSKVATFPIPHVFET